MACLNRTQYLTINELNELLQANYTEIDTNKIILASEVIKHYLFYDYGWTVDTCPLEIKEATAYQFNYMKENNGFDDIDDNGFSIGKFSMNNGGKADNTKIKLSKFAKMKLLDSGYIRRTL